MASPSHSATTCDDGANPNGDDPIHDGPIRGAIHDDPIHHDANGLPS